MASNEVHKDDIGVKFLITIEEDGVAKDISTMTTKQLIFTKPSKTKVVKTANFEDDGTDGQIYYTSVSGDLNEVGIWQIQARTINPVSDKRTDIARFKVHDNL